MPRIPTPHTYTYILSCTCVYFYAYVYRLGRNGSHELTQHPWLRDTDWTGLRTQKAPYIPAVKLVLVYYNIFNNDYICRIHRICVFVCDVVGFVGDVCTTG